MEDCCGGDVSKRETLADEERVLCEIIFDRL